MEQTAYYLGFNLIAGIGPVRLARLLAYFGTPQAAWEARRADLLAAGLDTKSCDLLVQRRQQINLDDELERVDLAGAQAICIDDERYPRLLRQIPQAPPLIYVRGTLHTADEWALAIVGTRKPTPYGTEAARWIASDLAAAGITIVSGLALGIDSVAHQAALEAQGRSIAVLASGVDLIYPERNRRLGERIIEQGALISDYPMGTLPTPTNFPPRNRLISGLSLGTLVVEAGARSGALITVEFALEQGRDVFAVPGSIFKRTSEGTNRLISNGAGLVSSAKDILEALNWESAAEQQELLQLTLPEDPTEAALLALIDYEPRHVDELSRSCGLPSATVAAALAMLELRGVVRQTGVMQYVMAREQCEAYVVQRRSPASKPR